METREEEIVELDGPPVLEIGQKVRALKDIRNDGTYGGFNTGDILVRKGNIGYVKNIGTFLQRYYIYGVDFIEIGRVVGMRAKELEELEE